MIRVALSFLLALWVAGASAQSRDAIAPVAAEAPVPMILNLAHVVDWGTQQPFINRMKAARPWIGHKPRQWGGVEAEELWARGLLDDNGWPLEIPRDVTSIATLIMTDLPEEAVSLSGRYLLCFEGTGIVEVAGRATDVRYGKNEVLFSFTPGPGGVEIKIQRTGRNGAHIRNISVVREDRAAAFDQGAVFNPDFLEVIQGFAGLRFMDWMLTNNATRSQWSERPKPDDYSYMHRGVPVEVMVMLANRIGANAWFTLPHRGEDAYFRAFAEIVEQQLWPDLTAYVEYSNEVWNWSFQQVAWADEQARARWGTSDQWMQFYGMRAAQMAMIWREVFEASPDRLKTVIASQAGWMGLEDQALNAPLWQAEGNPAPHTLFDGYAITGYFGGIIGTEGRMSVTRDWIEQSLERAEETARANGLSGQEFDSYVARHRYDHAFQLAGAELLDGRITGDPSDTVQDLLTRVLPYHAGVAADHGLSLMMYEGGTHVTGIGPVADQADLDTFFRAFNYSAEMGALYTHLIAGWADITQGPFAPFNDVYAPSRWGSWGGLRYLSDQNPRWDALIGMRDGMPSDG